MGALRRIRELGEVAPLVERVLARVGVVVFWRKRASATPTPT